MKSFRKFLEEATIKKYSVFAKIISLDNNTIFMAKRSETVDHPSVWAYVGGGVDEGETVEEALRRELKEEIGGLPEGYEIRNIEVKNYPNRIVYIYNIYVPTEFEPKLNDENETYIWVNSELNVSPLHPHL